MRNEAIDSLLLNNLTDLFTATIKIFNLPYLLLPYTIHFDLNVIDTNQNDSRRSDPEFGAAVVIKDKEFLYVMTYSVFKVPILSLQ